MYVDPNDIHNLNDNGRNYFLSRNPYHLLSYAAFGEAYYNITPDLKLTAGFRWTVDKKQAPQLPSWTAAGNTYGTPTRKVINLEWREPTGRIALDWKPDLPFTDETLLYGSYVRGYKAGGANPPPAMIVLSRQVCSIGCNGSRLNDLILDASLTHPEKFDAEYVDAFEMGTKNTVLDGRLTANLSAFYYDYRGYQISQIVNRSAVNLNFDAEVWGAELELDWRPLENLRLGFKGGYEKTRMAEGSQAIDLMDRTAGKEGWILVRPFPTLTANCVAPEWLLGYAYMLNVCAAYETGLDPATYMPYVPNPQEFANESTGEVGPLPDRLIGYPGYDPTSMANGNRGEGFLKDLSGNELPNAPDFTATITADYTLPLPSDWLMTLHTDLYYQSEAWTRIFNTEGYDKLKAYSNINLAAIFTNEDAGWTVMAYVKNVLDRDNITGAFLFSDDVGLTTNVFLNEPRLYGIRVTKNWTGGGGWWGGLFPDHKSGAPYPLTIEVGGQNQRRGASQEMALPFVDAFPTADIRGLQDEEHLNWNDGRDLRLTFQPSGSPWKVTAGVRYGRADSGDHKLRQEDVAGPEVCRSPRENKYNDYVPGVDFSFIGKLQCDPEYGPVTKTFDTKYGPYTRTFENKYDPDNLLIPINRIGASGRRHEEHMIVDFEVGKDVGVGVLGEGKSSLGAGLRYAEFKSSASGDLRGVPDLYVPEGWSKYDSTFHQYMASFETEREFKGTGPTLSWQASQSLWGDEQTGHLNLDWTITGGALFGKQKTTASGMQGSEYIVDAYSSIDWDSLPPPPQTPIDVASRSESATVPVLDLSLGLSYDIQRFTIGAGYRWERYFDVLDAGFEEHQSHGRTIDGPYFKLAIGFGG